MSFLDRHDRAAATARIEAEYGGLVGGRPRAARVLLACAPRLRGCARPTASTSR